MLKTKKLNDFLKIVKKQIPNLAFKRKEKFSSHTTMGVGGRIFAFCEVKDEDVLLKLLRLCHLYNVPHFILGNGSNLIASDRVHYLVVIKISSQNIKKEKNLLISDSGVSLFVLNSFAIKEGLSGLEWSCGIPGSVGGAVKMNAGSFGFEIKDVLKSVTYTDGAKIYTKDAKDLDFSYRHSYFSNNNFVILRAVFELKKGKSALVKQKSIEFFEKKQLLQPYSDKSAGSIFKKPNETYAPILIEKCALKGLKIGDAEVSQKHCGFIVNKGKAKFNEIFKIILKIKKTVFKKFGIMLDEEVIILK